MVTRRGEDKEVLKFIEVEYIVHSWPLARFSDLTGNIYKNVI